MSKEELRLRAETDEDAVFLKLLYFSTREDLLQLGLPPEMLSSLLDMQFSAQRSGYRRRFPTAENFILEKSGKPVGSMVRNIDDTGIRLVHIAFLPEERGKGYGRLIIGSLQQEAAMVSKPLSLSVDPGNDIAMNLYLSLGFRIERGDDANLDMIWCSETGT